MLHSRFELKYRITERQSEQIRDFIRERIDLDEFSAGKPHFSYPVHSLYLDSEDLKTYWNTINGNKNRFKLRLRYYDMESHSPVFFEIKRRMDRSIHKQRGGVRNERVHWLLAGHFPEQEHLVSKDDPKQMMALQRFCESMQQVGAQPRLHVAYEREAYVSEDDSHRVTIDRNIRVQPNLDGHITTEMPAPTLVYHGPLNVVLELKFTDRFPTWFRELVENFDLTQCSAAKYVEGVNRVGHEALGSSLPVEGEAHRKLQRFNQARLQARLGRVPSWVRDLD
jgi:hypothetical protein